MSSRDDRTTTPAGRQLLVLADRDAAEALAERWPALGPFELVRDALAGEDDAEDAQWLVVLEEPAEGWDAATVAAVDALAGEHEGWREDG
ncbi:hypothetical protein P3T35_000738 [Kitasatospora sp. GP30]|uniref:hypothetical protein n=1 Tax=Kitasatospora sp. GP30 TaxID=3035084 RepID=UPI000C70DAEE|nr:hypothetical protein [Kitasatospora sp. GP30]MDH6138749.1 hypothetical protein [Kitasatospora sp. GP30]